MTKPDSKALADAAIVLLREMFGEGVDFSYTTYFKSNEELSGIALKLPGCTNAPVVCLNDMLDDISAKDVADVVAPIFQAALRSYDKVMPVLPEMTREYVLENVVLQALSRKRNRQMLKAHPHIQFLDLAGIFRVPVGKWERNSLSTGLITNQIAKKLELTAEQLAEAARRNTISKFGIQLISTQEMGVFFTKGHHQEPKPFEDVEMTAPGLYTLTNGIEVNGAALILIPEILEAIGEKAGMDYYILPASIHELLIARDDGLVTGGMLKRSVFEGNRTPEIVKPEHVLSDNVYHYSRKTKLLKII